jgi:hypothetical protein
MRLAIPSAEALALGVCISLTGCAGVSIGGDHIRWTEEVKLSGGGVVEIQRHVENHDPGFGREHRGTPLYHEICYPPLGLHWKSRGAYQPDIFDIVDGKAYVHVPVAGQVQCEEQDYPVTGAGYFRWDENKWTRIDAKEFPAASEWNLLRSHSGGRTGEDANGRITLTDKAKGRWSDGELKFLQKRQGWKRLSDPSRSQGCRPHARTTYCIDAQCTALSDAPRNPKKSMFHEDTTNTCQQ